MKISIGDSTRGYDMAEVTRSASGAYRLVPGTLGQSRKRVVRSAIAALNRGDASYVSPAGDYYEIRIDGVAPTPAPVGD